MLSLSATCDDVELAEDPVVMGGIFTSEQEGTVPIYQYAQSVYPWDHLYALNQNAGTETYALQWQIGWVYPPAAL